MGIVDAYGRDSMGKTWEDMGTGTKLTILREGISFLINTQIVIMKHLGIKPKEVKDGEETGSGVNTEGNKAEGGAGNEGAGK